MRRLSKITTCLDTQNTLFRLGMRKTSFAPEFKDLPDILPIFPLEGVILLPGAQLPLNIFEPRYLAMTEAALASNRLIGMIQPKSTEPKHNGQSQIYTTGCAGKIIEFSETADGRYLISLQGIARFKVSEELTTMTGFRQVKPIWDDYKDDLNNSGDLGLDREKLITLLANYFKDNGMECDWSAIEKTDDSSLIAILSMACPLSAGEKQALIEAKTCADRADVFMTLIEMSHEKQPEHSQH